jgi:hypothetical protein
MPAGGEFAARYVHPYSMCQLCESWLASDSTTVAQVALTLVHEGVHARLCRLGFAYDDTRTRFRIERVCVRGEAAFARRLPDSTCVGAQVEQEMLDMSGSEFTDAAFANRRVSALRELGAPSWIIRWAAGKLQSARDE